MPRRTSPAEKDLPSFRDKDNAFRAAVRRQLLAGEWVQLQGTRDELLRSKARFGTGWWKLTSFYEALSDPSDVHLNFEARTYVQRLQDWKRLRPDSEVARLALAKAYFLEGSRIRGSDWAGRTGREQMEMYQQYSGRAGKELEWFSSRTVTDPVYYATRISEARARSFSRSYTEKIFQQGLRLEPEYLDLHVAMGVYLLPQWFGDRDDFKRFAERSVEATRKTMGEMMYARMAIIALNTSFSTDMFRNSGLEWTRVKRGCEDQERLFPDSFRNLSYCAHFAYLANDREAARPMFARLGNQWNTDSSDVWRDSVYLEQARQWASSGGPSSAKSWVQRSPSEWPILVFGSELLQSETNASVRGTAFIVRASNKRLFLATALEEVDTRRGASLLRPQVDGQRVRWRLAPANGGLRKDFVGSTFGITAQTGEWVLTSYNEKPSNVEPLDVGRKSPRSQETVFIVYCAGPIPCRQEVLSGKVDIVQGIDQHIERFYIRLGNEDIRSHHLRGSAVLDRDGKLIGVVAPELIERPDRDGVPEIAVRSVDKILPLLEQ